MPEVSVSSRLFIFTNIANKLFVTKKKRVSILKPDNNVCNVSAVVCNVHVLLGESRSLNHCRVSLVSANVVSFSLVILMLTLYLTKIFIY